MFKMLKISNIPKIPIQFLRTNYINKYFPQDNNTHENKNTNTNNKSKNKQDTQNLLDYLVDNSQEILENHSKKESKNFRLFTKVGQLKYSIAGILATSVLIYHGIITYLLFNNFCITK